MKQIADAAFKLLKKAVRSNGDISIAYRLAAEAMMNHMMTLGFEPIVNATGITWKKRADG